MKAVLRYIGIFFATLCLLIGLLVLSYTIPQEKIYENSKASAEYMAENETDFYMPLLSEDLFELHDYADAIWLSIAYNADTEHPLKSALEGKYYNGFGDRLYNLYFYRDSVNYDYEANTDYYRYWHGTVMFLRPLLTKFTYMDIRYINVLLLTGLSLVLVILLQHRLDWKAAMIFGSSLLAVNFFVVPYCIEYVPMFYLMFISSILILYLKDKQRIAELFLITGICSNFFDFLTVETITLCVPLVIHFYDLYIRGEAKHFKENLKYFIRLCVLWLCGYLFTWISKWLLTAAVLGQNVMSNVTESIFQRSIEAVEELSFFEQLKNAVILNIRGIFPFRITKGPAGTILMLLVILAILFVLWFLYRKKKQEPVAVIFLFIALIPYIRYLVMSNHSYTHSWFTFRAQLGSIMAILLAVAVNLDEALLQKEWDQKKWIPSKFKQKRKKGG